MALCEVCGNDYYLSFEVVTAGNKHIFDCFECAIHMLAPRCAHCGCNIIGHGVEAERTFFCGAHCAREAGVEGARDRVGTFIGMPTEVGSSEVRPGTTGGHVS